MARAWAAAALLSVGFLAGCLGAPQADLERGLAVDVAAATLALDPGPLAVGGDALLWNGSALDARGEAAERWRVRVDLPSGFWDAYEGALEFSLRWELYGPLQLRLTVFDEEGAEVATGRSPRAFVGAQNNGLPILGSASVVLLPRAPSGTYVVEARATQGAGAYVAMAQLEARARTDGEAEPRLLLPNVVTLPPRDLGIRSPEADPPAGTKGCRADEVVFGQTMRCLRFSNGVGNAGEGPLDLSLTVRDGLLGAAGGGAFVQRLHRTDGSVEERPLGPAAFHPQHAHFHYQDAATFDLYAYDLATGTRGDLVVEGRKTGFCFADLDFVDNGLPYTSYPRFDATRCWDPTVADGRWETGLNPTWYDRYHWSWFEQYVDVTRVGDGVYELVSTSNAGGTLVETDPADNVASVVFSMRGDAVEELFVPGPGRA